MKKVVFDNPHRQKHFDFFRQMDQPHFGVTAVIDIYAFLQYIREKEIPFTASMVFAISYTLNEIPEFRYRIRGEEVIEHELIHPSFTVTTAVSDVFSFCSVPFSFNATEFIGLALTKIEEMKEKPSFEDEEGRDDFIFLSAMPWISFTSVMHPMHYHPVDSIPRVVWGKYEKKEDKILMPIALQAHHALVDGVHAGRFFQFFEKKMQHPELFFEKK